MKKKSIFLLFLMLCLFLVTSNVSFAATNSTKNIKHSTKSTLNNKVVKKNKKTVKKKIVKKKKVIKKRKEKLIQNAPLIDPNNPPGGAQ